MKIETLIAGIKTPFVGTASGCLDTTLAELTTLAAATDFLTLKSTTLDPRVGNPEPRYAGLDYGSIQRMGLPNLGSPETFANVKAIARPGLTIKASIAGFSMYENMTLLHDFQKSAGVSLIEFNISCPNVEKKPLAYDFNLLDVYLQKMMPQATKPVGLKLPFYNDPDKQKAIVKLAVKHGIKFITTINSIQGLCIGVEDESVVLSQNGVGGVGGSYIQPFALLECHRYAGLLKGTGISLIGVGGVDSGAAAFRFALTGCDAVEVGSHLQANGPPVIQKINNELAEILQRKGYRNIAEVKGQLKFL